MLRKTVSSRVIRLSLVLLLALVALYQTYFVVFNYGKLWVSRILRTPHMSSMERNALFLLGGKGSDFMDFIALVVPHNGTVVIPPGSGQFSKQNILQFFLMPRGIPSCRCDVDAEEYSEYCIQCLRKTEHYVPSIGDFPSSKVMQGWKRFIPFEQDTGWFHGVYIPLDASFPSQNIPQIKEVPRLLAFVLDLSIYCAIFILGLLISSLFCRPLDWCRSLVVGIPVGAGLLTWFVFLISWLGFPLTRATFFIAYIFLLIFVIVIHLISKDQNKIISFPRFSYLSLHNILSTRPAILVTWFLIVSLFILSTLISIGRGYSLFDGIANWALKGYGIALEGAILAGQEWGGHSLSYPQNIHIIIALFKLVDGDILPGSKFMFPIFAASLLLGCYNFWRRLKLNELISSLSLLILFSLPVLFFHSTIGWGNLIFTTYIILGTIYCAEGLISNRSDILHIGGLLMALAAWTRPEGIAFASVIIITLLIVLFLIGKLSRLKPGWLLPIVIIPGSWLVFGIPSMRRDEIGQVIFSFLQTHAEGGLDLQVIITLFEYSLDRFLTTDTWGLIFPLIIIIFILGFLSFKRSISDYVFPIFLSSIIALLFPLFMFFVASSSKSNFDLFLQVSFDRALLPFSILALCFALLINRHCYNSSIDESLT